MISKFVLLFTFLFVFGFSANVENKVYIPKSKILINKDGIFLSSNQGAPIKLAMLSKDEKGFYFKKNKQIRSGYGYACPNGHPSPTNTGLCNNEECEYYFGD
ncbi:MAG: hypothetical protein K940chlam8_00760 [Chlamydiae bacterium]|nr:hypothetical protein [Chlamydiota bacterium]